MTDQKEEIPYQGCLFGIFFTFPWMMFAWLFVLPRATEHLIPLLMLLPHMDSETASDVVVAVVFVVILSVVFAVRLLVDSKFRKNVLGHRTGHISN